MGSIGKYIFRTTLASLALIPVSLARALRVVRRSARALGGVDPILTLPGFDRRAIPALAIGESKAGLLRRPVTA